MEGGFSGFGALQSLTVTSSISESFPATKSGNMAGLQTASMWSFYFCSQGIIQMARSYKKCQIKAINLPRPLQPLLLFWSIKAATRLKKNKIKKEGWLGVCSSQWCESSSRSHTINSCQCTCLFFWTGSFPQSVSPRVKDRSDVSFLFNKTAACWVRPSHRIARLQVSLHCDSSDFPPPVQKPTLEHLLRLHLRLQQVA